MFAYASRWAARIKNFFLTLETNCICNFSNVRVVALATFTKVIAYATTVPAGVLVPQRSDPTARPPKVRVIKCLFVLTLECCLLIQFIGMSGSEGLVQRQADDQRRRGRTDVRWSGASLDPRRNAKEPSLSAGFSLGELGSLFRFHNENGTATCRSGFT